MGYNRGGKTRFDLLCENVESMSKKLDSLVKSSAGLEARVTSLEECYRDLRSKIRSCQDNCYPSIRKLENTVNMVKVSAVVGWTVLASVLGGFWFLFEKGFIVLNF